MVMHREVTAVDRRGHGRDQTWMRRVEERGPPFMPSSLRRRVRLSWRCAHPALGKPTQAHLACPMIKRNGHGEGTEPTSTQEIDLVRAAGRSKLDEPRTIDIESPVRSSTAAQLLNCGSHSFQSIQFHRP